MGSGRARLRDGDPRPLPARRADQAGGGAATAGRRTRRGRADAETRRGRGSGRLPELRRALRAGLGVLLAVREEPDAHIRASAGRGPAAATAGAPPAAAPTADAADVRRALRHPAVSRVLQPMALVVTDRRWAAPLSALALGLGVFVGVAIGPGAAGTFATGSQVVEIPETS